MTGLLYFIVVCVFVATMYAITKRASLEEIRAEYRLRERTQAEVADLEQQIEMQDARIRALQQAIEAQGDELKRTKNAMKDEATTHLDRHTLERDKAHEALGLRVSAIETALRIHGHRP